LKSRSIEENAHGETSFHKTSRRRLTFFNLPGAASVCILSSEVFLMITRKLVLGSVLSLGLFASGVLVGQNVSPRRHPNLAAAQRLMEQAVGRIDAAQAANEFDMNGHAQKAKELLGRAFEEVKMAAETANHR
jgi:hypothetical protein